MTWSKKVASDARLGLGAKIYPLDSVWSEISKFRVEHGTLKLALITQNYGKVNPITSVHKVSP